MWKDMLSCLCGKAEAFKGKINYRLKALTCNCHSGYTYLFDPGGSTAASCSASASTGVANYDALASLFLYYLADSINIDFNIFYGEFGIGDDLRHRESPLQ